MRLIDESLKILLYKPNSLDIFSLIEEGCLPIGDLDFLLKRKKSTGAYYNLNKAAVLISKIVWGELFNRINKEKFPHWVSLNKKNLEYACGCKNNVLNRIIFLLEKLGVIEVSHTYVSSNPSSGFTASNPHCKTYCFTPKFRGKKAVEFEFPYKVSRAQSKYFNLRPKKDVRPQTDLECWLEANIMGLNYDEGVYDFLEAYFKNENSNAANCAMLMVDVINSSRKFDEYGNPIPGYFFNRTNQVNRVFTPITSVKREVRPFLRLDGVGFVELDQHASQPFLLLERYKHVVNHQLEEARAEAYNYHKLFDVFGEGNFYANFGEIAGLELSAEELKGAFIRGGLNCRNHVQPPKGISSQHVKAIIDTFREYFPILYGQLCILKFNRDRSIAKELKRYKNGKEKLHAQFGIYMQKLESSIFIDGICNELMAKNIFCYTVHDAIGCLEQNVEEVKCIMKRHIRGRVGFEPKIKV